MHLKVEITKKTATKEEEEKVLVHQDNGPCHKPIATMAKLHELHFEMLRSHPILQIWPPATTGCLQTSKECSRKRDLAPMKEVISESEAYFETKDKSFYKKGIELLEKRWNQSITLEGDYVDE